MQGEASWSHLVFNSWQRKTLTCWQRSSVAVTVNLTQTNLLICHIFIDCSLVDDKEAETMSSSWRILYLLIIKRQTTTADTDYIFREITFIEFISSTYIIFCFCNRQLINNIFVLKMTWQALASRIIFPPKKCLYYNNNFHWPKTVHFSISENGNDDSHA